jgi:hypothetical protein
MSAFVQTQAGRRRAGWALAALLTFGHAAMAVEGRFEATVDGTATTIDLRTHAGTVNGVYTEGPLAFRLEGELKGDRLDARLIEPQSGLQIAVMVAELEADALDARIDARNPLSGETASTRARFVRADAGRVATPRPPSPAADPSATAGATAGALDPALVGTWVNDENINSGGGNFASFSTRMNLLLKPDGSVEQWSESVGGGGDWSYSGDGPQLQYQGRWQSQGGTLLVQLQGMDSFQPAASYRFSGEYLVTEQDGGRRIWQRGR